jgi:hypothetical protein
MALACKELDDKILGLFSIGMQIKTSKGILPECMSLQKMTMLFFIIYDPFVS